MSLSVLLCSFGWWVLPPSPPADSLTLQRLRAALLALQSDTLTQTGLVAFALRSAQTGQTLVELNSRQSAIPASTLKLVTTATALSLLGPDFTYPTTLEYDGTLADSVLNGNLYVRGSGDPTLGSDRFPGFPDLNALTQQWAERVRAAGIRQINGAVVADASISADNATPPDWSWGDMGNYYGAAAYGLNINENAYRLVFRAGKAVGAPASVVRTEPEVLGIQLVNQVRTAAAGTGDQTVVFGAPYQPLHYLEGTIPLGRAPFMVKGSLPDPPFQCAQHLHWHLIAAGVRLRDDPTTDRLLRRRVALPTAPRRPLYVHQSPPLRDIIKATNFESLNLYAEALLNILGARLAPSLSATAPPMGTTARGLGVVRQCWQGRGLDLRGWFMQDGSGLSYTNAITAEQLTRVLGWMARDEVFYASLPTVGESGTVRNLGRGTRAAGNLRAKSGTVARVKAYAGYATSQSGERLCFALLVNNHDDASRRVRDLMEAVLVALADL